MSLRYHAAVVCVVVFLTFIDAVVADTGRALTSSQLAAGSIITSPNIDNGRRYLRVEEAVNVDEDGDDFSASEERGVVSSQVSKIYNAFSSNKKPQPFAWALADKSEESVKKALKLKGLSGDALKSHKNYKYFEEFVQMAENLRLARWRSDGVSTSAVWTKAGLANVRSMDQLEQATYTDGFRIYTSFVMQLDDVAIKKGSVAGKLGADASDMEKMARTLIMKRRPDSYAKSVLGLDNLSGAELKNSANFKYYEMFLHLNNK